MGASADHLRGVRYAGHLGRRFVGSLWPGGPAPADEAWALTHLGAGEVALWRRMSGPDRRHAVGVARRVVASWPAGEGTGPARPVVAAALLHDVGKVESRLGTFGRVGATVFAVASRRRIGRYLRHDEIGAGLLAGAGSDPLTVAWAREHHLPASRWTVPAEIGHALKAADDD